MNETQTAGPNVLDSLLSLLSRGVDTLMGRMVHGMSGATQVPAIAPSPLVPPAAPAAPAAPVPVPALSWTAPPALPTPAAAGGLEESGVTLVEYSIVSVRRGDERLLPGGSGQILVTDRMSGESFAIWMIARYLQEPGHPLPPADRRSLRVAYQVLDRWEEQSLHFKGRQLEVLDGIRRAILDCCPPRPISLPAAAPVLALPPAPATPAVAESPPATPAETAAGVLEEVAETGERDRVLAALRELGGEAATAQLVRRTGLGNSQVRRSLRALEAQGRVRRSGQGLQTRYHAVEKAP